VKIVRCDGCGAAVDLERGSACGYCRAAVSTLDPAHVERIVRELRAADENRQTVDPTLPFRLAMDRVAVDRFFISIERESGRSVDLENGIDLVGAGIGAVLGMLAGND
jgi:hypothetical protein